MSNAVPGKTSVDMVIGGGVSTLRSPFNRHASRQVPEVTDTLEGTVEAASTRALPLGSTAILTVPKEITRLCFAENAQNIVAQLPGIRNIFQCGKKKKNISTSLRRILHSAYTIIRQPAVYVLLAGEGNLDFVLSVQLVVVQCIFRNTSACFIHILHESDIFLCRNESNFVQVGILRE